MLEYKCKQKQVLKKKRGMYYGKFNRSKGNSSREV